MTRIICKRQQRRSKTSGRWSHKHLPQQQFPVHEYLVKPSAFPILLTCTFAQDENMFGKWCTEYMLEVVITISICQLCTSKCRWVKCEVAVPCNYLKSQLARRANRTFVLSRRNFAGSHQQHQKEMQAFTRSPAHTFCNLHEHTLSHANTQNPHTSSGQK